VRSANFGAMKSTRSTIQVDSDSNSSDGGQLAIRKTKPPSKIPTNGGTNLVSGSDAFESNASDNVKIGDGRADSKAVNGA
jgi:hypothetical protein